MTTITVIIPTYRRPQDLLRCLAALNQQHRMADEVIIVARSSDSETLDALRRASAAKEEMPPHIRTVEVEEPGQVRALNAGLDASRGDLIAITDDDTAPCPDWLSKIEQHFAADERLGGLGGRDWVHEATGTREGQAKTVGIVQWFGRTIGDHHLGFGAPREVDVLKGANMAYRRTAISALRFDDRLRGTGAQVHNDMAFSLAVKRTGYKVVFDPSVVVKHYPASRFDEDQRSTFTPEAVSNSAYNETLILVEHLNWLQRWAYTAWAVLIGSRGAPGLAQFVRMCLTRQPNAWPLLLATAQGRLLYLRSSRRYRV